MGMQRSQASIWIMGLAALLSGCGGDAGSTAASGGNNGGGATTGTCSLRARQDWAFATLNEWYLFPETLPASLDPTPFTDVPTYIDALTATARSQGRDRYFSYLTSIAEENAFNNSGASAGIGVRLSSDITTKKTFVSEAFEGAPGLAAGLDRGTEIIAIGDTPTNLRLVSDIITASGVAGVTDALGPTTAGVTRTLRITNASGTRDVTITKASYSLSPVSSRYGSQVIIDNGRKIGYLNLRTFINTADNQLRSAFSAFRGQGITDFVIDLRYNGGGLVSTAELLGDLLGGNRATQDVFDVVSYRATKAANNTTKRFSPQSQSVSPIRVAFIGTGATASASELVINGFIPYLGSNMALIGANTYGKPVGQVAIDRSACDDRFRVIAFSIRNAANSDAYYSGLAATVPNSCKADDDVTKPFGDANEASVRTALDFLAGRPCTPIASSGQVAQALRDSGRRLMSVENPSVAQREVVGLF
jgi:carboxyl-terminal processing protease